MLENRIKYPRNCSTFEPQFPFLSLLFVTPPPHTPDCHFTKIFIMKLISHVSEFQIDSQSVLTGVSLHGSIPRNLLSRPRFDRPSCYCCNRVVIIISVLFHFSLSVVVAYLGLTCKGLLNYDGKCTQMAPFVMVPVPANAYIFHLPKQPPFHPLKNTPLHHRSLIILLLYSLHSPPRGFD